MKKLKKVRPEATFKNIEYVDEIDLNKHVIGVSTGSKKSVITDLQGVYELLNDELVSENSYEAACELIDELQDNQEIFVFETRKAATIWLIS